VNEAVTRERSAWEMGCDRGGSQSRHELDRPDPVSLLRSRRPRRARLHRGSHSQSDGACRGGSRRLQREDDAGAKHAVRQPKRSGCKRCRRVLRDRDDPVVQRLRDPSSGKGRRNRATVANNFTLAHEIGHVLGLSHIAGEPCGPGFTPTALMTACSTSLLTGTPPPTTSAAEAGTMLGSGLTAPC
jgi:hypothetical protein